MVGTKRSRQANQEDEEVRNLKLKDPFDAIQNIRAELHRIEALLGEREGQLHEKEGITEDIQDIFSGDGLQEDRRLVDHSIQNSNLQLVLQNHTVMKLYVKMLSSQKTIVVEAISHDTIQNIKSLVQQKEGIDRSDRFSLIYDGDLLEEEKTLASLHMKSESTLHLVFCPKHLISFSVKAPSGDVVKLKVEILFTVGDVKAIVGSVIGVSVSNQNLMYDGKELQDSKTLAFHDIKEDSLLELQPLLPPPIQEELLLEMPPSSIEILVKTPPEKILKLQVKASLTVHKVKTFVRDIMGVSIRNHCIFYAGRKLEDDETLASYDIKNQFMLEVSPPSFQIFIKTWRGKTITLDVHLANTIKDVKVMLFDKLRIPINRQSFVFAGKKLEPDRNLASYNIQRHSTLHMVFAPSSKFVKMKLNTINLPISRYTTISQMKKMAETKFQVPIKEVLFREVVLQDERPLSAYVITMNAEVTLVFEA